MTYVLVLTERNVLPKTKKKPMAKLDSSLWLMFFRTVNNLLAEICQFPANTAVNTSRSHALLPVNPNKHAVFAACNVSVRFLFSFYVFVCYFEKVEAHTSSLSRSTDSSAPARSRASISIPGMFQSCESGESPGHVASPRRATLHFLTRSKKHN